jgi:hypothetical protein
MSDRSSLVVPSTTVATKLPPELSPLDQAPNGLPASNGEQQSSGVLHEMETDDMHTTLGKHNDEYSFSNEAGPSTRTKAKRKAAN